MASRTRVEVLRALVNETVYLFDSFEDLVAKHAHGSGWFVKRRGGTEFQPGPSSTITMEAMNGIGETTEEITAEQYAAFC